MHYRFEWFSNCLKTGFAGERIISFSKLEILEKRLEYNVRRIILLYLRHV